MNLSKQRLMHPCSRLMSDLVVKSLTQSSKQRWTMLEYTYIFYHLKQGKKKGNMDRAKGRRRRGGDGGIGVCFGFVRFRLHKFFFFSSFGMGTGMGLNWDRRKLYRHEFFHLLLFHAVCQLALFAGI